MGIEFSSRYFETLERRFNRENVTTLTVGRLSQEWLKNRSFKLRRSKPSCDSEVSFLERGLRNTDSTYAKCRPERVPGVVLGQGTQGNDRRRHHEKGTRLRLIQGYIRRQP